MILPKRLRDKIRIWMELTGMNCKITYVELPDGETYDHCHN